MMDRSEKFWRKWIKSDSLEREKMIEKTIISGILETEKLPKKYKKHSLKTMINAYLEDFYWSMEKTKKAGKTCNSRN